MFKVFTQDMDIRDADNCTKCGMVGYGKLVEDKFVCTTCLTKNPDIQTRERLFDDEFRKAYVEKIQDGTLYRGED